LNRVIRALTFGQPGGKFFFIIKVIYLDKKILRLELKNKLNKKLSDLHHNPNLSGTALESRASATFVQSDKINIYHAKKSIKRIKRKNGNFWMPYYLIDCLSFIWRLFFFCF
jgi:hypothetical protein